ncbi:MAG TPA: BamA/TamA family outer membrane protein [Candidatus Eisenbacteria bacterium]|nr:BamA/TamA family outer membrane protein [Candidatus Eisenbacteria bacterium]
MGLLAAGTAWAADEGGHSPLIDPEDGWVDVSSFLDKSYGFVPVVVPITEPAVGYGAAFGLVFIDKAKREGSAGFGRPTMTAVGGLATENGSRGVAAGDVRYWLDDRLQTVALFGYAPINLTFYGLGDVASRRNPLSYSLTPLGGLLSTKYRLGARSRWWAGLGYSYASTKVEFDVPASVPPEIGRASGEIGTGGLTPAVSYDSRNNAFTPTGGIYAETSFGVFGELLGSDTNFQKAAALAMGYAPLSARLTLGLRGDASATLGDIPFYMRPYISLRGAEAMRYQGEEVAQAEVELRWQFWKRISAVGLWGLGSAWNDLGGFDNRETITTYGAGVRYEIARRYGLHVGADVAFGPDDPILYIQFGSAWMRP